MIGETSCISVLRNCGRTNACLLCAPLRAKQCFRSNTVAPAIRAAHQPAAASTCGAKCKAAPRRQRLGGSATRVRRGPRTADAPNCTAQCSEHPVVVAVWYATRAAAQHSTPSTLQKSGARERYYALQRAPSKPCGVRRGQEEVHVVQVQLVRREGVHVYRVPAPPHRLALEAPGTRPRRPQNTPDPTTEQP